MSEETINLFDDEHVVLEANSFRDIAQLKFLPAGKAMMIYLEMNIKRDLQSLLNVDPSNIGAVAQLQARCGANGVLRALIAVDETKFDEPEEIEDGEA